MKQVNFKELNVEVGIDKFQPRDLRKDFGDTLHRASESVPMSELARKIYYSEGPLEISDEDFGTMLILMKTAFKKYIVDAVEKAGEDSINNKEE